MNRSIRVYISTLLILAFILIFKCEIAAQQTSWLKRIGGEEENVLTSTVLNKAGEIIIAGSFIYGNGQMPIDNIILKSEAPTDFRCGFIAKLDGTGQVIWARVLNSNRFGSIENVVLDTEDNIYVTGRFHGVLTFGNQTFTENSYTPQHFIAKYDAEGNPLWLKHIPGEVNIEVIFCIDNQNSLYVACRQGKPVGNAVETTRLVLFKYDSNGVPLMESVISTISPSSPFYIRDIVVDANQQPIIVGTFMNSITIGDKVFEGRSMSDAYILKCNSDGSLKWANQIGKGEQFSSVLDMTIDGAENIYVSGSFSNKSDQVSLLLKFNPAGDQTWQFSVDRKVNSSYMGGIAGHAVKVSNKDQSIILAGDFRGTVAFGNTILNSQRDEYEYDVFIAKIEQGEEIAGAIQSSGDGTTRAGELVLTQDESFYLAGHTVSSTLKISEFLSGRDKTNWDIFLYKEKIKVLDTNQVPKEEPAPEPDNNQLVTIPNIFTPNGDNKNQHFEIAGLDIDQNNSLVVYNRWGKQVYQSQSYQNNWKAEGLAEGTYFYVLYLAKERRHIKGWVNVVR